MDGIHLFKRRRLSIQGIPTQEGQFIGHQQSLTSCPRLLDGVCVDGRRRNTPDERLVICAHPRIIRLANQYTAGGQKVIIGLPKKPSDPPKYSIDRG